MQNISTVNNFDDLTNLKRQLKQQLDISRDLNTLHAPPNINSNQIPVNNGLNKALLVNSNRISSRCTCMNKNSKIFNCIECTRNYPVSVRRSKDGEEENNHSYLKINHHVETKSPSHIIEQTYDYKNLNESSGEETSSSSTSSSSSSISNKSSSTSSSSNISINQIKLKPSPIPVSSTLLSLLSLTQQSSNRSFVAPPNRTIFQTTSSNSFHNQQPVHHHYNKHNNS